MVARERPLYGCWRGCSTGVVFWLDAVAGLPEKNIEAALTMLAELSPDKDLDALQNDLEQMIFASNVLGKLSIHESRKAAQSEDE